MTSPIRPNRLPERDRKRNGKVDLSYAASSKDRQSKFLDDRFWQPYRSKEELAQRIYDLTHPGNRLVSRSLEPLLNGQTF